VEDPQVYYYKKMADRYLSDRDGYREEGGLPSKWIGCDLKAMASVHKLPKKGVEKAATDLRFIFFLREVKLNYTSKSRKIIQGKHHSANGNQLSLL
jgi:hypothetical protein